MRTQQYIECESPETSIEDSLFTAARAQGKGLAAKLWGQPDTLGENVLSFLIYKMGLATLSCLLSMVVLNLLPQQSQKI